MEEINLTCPACWQSICLYLETDIGEDTITIVEDCTVCCRPIEITYSVNDSKIKNLEHRPIEGNSF